MYTIEWDINDVRGALEAGFDYIEKMDHIVGYIYTAPSLAKEIVLSSPEDVKFDYIPEGLGFIRTAYFKIRPNSRDNEIVMENQDKNLKVRLFLICRKLN